MKKTFTKVIIALALGLGIVVGGAQTAQQVSAASGVITIHYVKGYGIALWNSPDEGRKPIAGRKLMDGSAWKFGQTKVVNGVTWYQLGTNQWVQGTYVTANSGASASTVKIDKSKKGVLTINYLYGYSLLVRKTPNGVATSPAKYLKHGTHWKYSATATVNYNTWYQLGTNQWIDGRYVLMGSVQASDRDGYRPVGNRFDLHDGAGYSAPNAQQMYNYNPAKDMNLSAKEREDHQKFSDLQNEMSEAQDAGDWATADKFYDQMNRYNTVGHF